MEKKNNVIIAVIVGALVVAGGIGFIAMNSNEDTENTSSTPATTETETSKKEDVMEKPSSSVVELAVATPDLSTLVTAVQAASLVDTLNGTGPFTVFAPTNAAFAALPAGTLDSLLLPESKATLSGILTYHVVAGKVMSKDLSNGQVITTVNGATLTVEIVDGKVMLVDAKGGKSTVATADIEASNGVVHVIDAVLLP